MLHFPKLSLETSQQVCRTTDAYIASSCRHFSTATKRRRRGARGSALIDETPNQIATSTVDHRSIDRFQAAADQLFNLVEKSIAKLKDCNEGLEIVRLPPLLNDTHMHDDTENDNRNSSHQGQLLIHIPASGDSFWGGGTYKLTIHCEPIDGVDRQYNGYVSMQSPLSGTYTYIYSVHTGEWEGTEDGHSLLGMFTRDFIRQCQGVPDF
jgi:hypothetical protein